MQLRLLLGCITTCRARAALVQNSNAGCPSVPMRCRTVCIQHSACHVTEATLWGLRGALRRACKRAGVGCSSVHAAAAAVPCWWCDCPSAPADSMLLSATDAARHLGNYPAACTTIVTAWQACAAGRCRRVAAAACGAASASEHQYLHVDEHAAALNIILNLLLHVAGGLSLVLRLEIVVAVLARHGCKLCQGLLLPQRCCRCCHDLLLRNCSLRLLQHLGETRGKCTYMVALDAGVMSGGEAATSRWAYHSRSAACTAIATAQIALAAS